MQCRYLLRIRPTRPGIIDCCTLVCKLLLRLFVEHVAAACRYKLPFSCLIRKVLCAEYSKCDNGFNDNFIIVDKLAAVVACHRMPLEAVYWSLLLLLLLLLLLQNCQLSMPMQPTRANSKTGVARLVYYSCCCCCCCNCCRYCCCCCCCCFGFNIIFVPLQLAF